MTTPPPPCAHQPLVRAGGLVRFWGNSQVQALVEHHPMGLEDLFDGPFSQEEKGQVMELLGWPLARVQAHGWALELTAGAAIKTPCHPVQPLWQAPDGQVRFKSNSLVRHLLDTGPLDLNGLPEIDGAPGDREQLAQLIGYSFRGACELSYMTDAVLERAWKEWESRPARARQARLAAALPPSSPPSSPPPRL